MGVRGVGAWVYYVCVMGIREGINGCICGWGRAGKDAYKSQAWRACTLGFKVAAFGRNLVCSKK